MFIKNSDGFLLIRSSDAVGMYIPSRSAPVDQ
jgi:hypothetical protein